MTANTADTAAGGRSLIEIVPRKILKQEFFLRPARDVARELLGKFLARRKNNKILASQIREVEIYDGFSDRASHASRGRTERNKIMFAKGGVWYVYFTYGRHWMLNIVVGSKNYPSAILIRGAGGIKGPARLTKFLGIDKKFNGKIADKKTGLWIEDRGIKISSRQIKKAPRVGVAYAGPRWAGKKWRFFIK